MKKFFENKPRAWFVIGLIVVLLITAGGVYYGYSNVLAWVGKDRVTKADLRNALYGFDFEGTPEKPRQKDNQDLKNYLLKRLIRESVIKQEAEKRDLEVAEEEVLARVEKDSTYNLKTDLQKEMSREAAKNSLLEEKLKDDVLSYSEGNYILINFDKYLMTDKAKYELEKEQARALADDLYAKLDSGAITFEQAKSVVEEHPVFGEKAFKEAGFTVLIAGELNKKVYDKGLGIVNNPELLKLIRETRVGKYSKPTVLQVNESQGEENRNTVDGIYVIVKIDKMSDGETDDFDTWIDQKTSDYTKSPLDKVLEFLKLKEARAAWAGSCGGGLVPTGSNQPAGFFVHYYYTAANGVKHDLPNAEVYIESTDTGDTYNWGGVTRSCDTGEVMCMGCSPDKPINGAWFQQHWTAMGYASCGGNGYGLLCSCAQNYRANFKFNSWNTDLGHFSGVDYFFADGVSTARYKSNPFDFSAVTNGATSGIDVHYRYEYRPTIVPTNPPREANFSMTENIYIYANASDDDGDAVNAKVAICKVDGSNNCLGSWEYFESGLYDGGNRRIKSYLPASLRGVGRYKWLVAAQDAHGHWNATPAGSPNYWSHNDPWYFTVTDSSTVTYHSNTAVPTTRVQSFTTGVDVNIEGQGSFTNAGYDFVNWNTAANGTGTTFTAGSTHTLASSLTLYAQWRPTPLSCNCNPDSGLSPLVVRVTCGGGLSPYNFNFGETTLLNRTSPVYYTYGSAGDKKIEVTDSAASKQSFSCTVNVANPTNTDGGEVAP